MHSGERDPMVLVMGSMLPVKVQWKAVCPRIGHLDTRGVGWRWSVAEVAFTDQG